MSGLNGTAASNTAAATQAAPQLPTEVVTPALAVTQPFVYYVHVHVSTKNEIETFDAKFFFTFRMCSTPYDVINKLMSSFYRVLYVACRLQRMLQNPPNQQLKVSVKTKKLKG